jgi:hypothetical protein
MKLNISKETYEPKWVKFDDCELLIEPYPMGLNDLVISPDQKMTIPGAQRKEMFMYSLKDWKGIEDANGLDLKCTKEAKETVFNHNLGGIAGFVYQYNSTFETNIKKELSDLQSGQDGTSIKEARPATTAEDK